MEILASARACDVVCVYAAAWLMLFSTERAVAQPPFSAVLLFNTAKYTVGPAEWNYVTIRSRLVAGSLRSA
jgi:hypothetical protein